MTDYSPLHDARAESAVSREGDGSTVDGSRGEQSKVGDRVTIDDMIAAGYDNFDLPDSPKLAHVQQELAHALDALDGQIFDDPAKWATVNSIVAAMKVLDVASESETTFVLETVEVTEDVDWSDEPVTYEVTEITTEFAE